MKFKVDRKVMDYLSEFDLTEREIIVYLTLLRTGPNTIMNLARETGIKRSTTHNNVEELVNKGLVSQTNYGERRMVVAEEPEKLKFLIEERKWKTKKLEDNMSTVIKSIYDLVPTAKENASVEMKYYSGIQGFKDVCQRSLDYSEDQIFAIINMPEWLKVYTDDYDKEYYLPTRLKRNKKLNILTFGDELTEGMQKLDSKNLRETRFISKDYLFKTTILVYGNEVSIMTSSEPYLGIVISDPEVSAMFKSLFNIIWNNTKS